MHKCVCCWVSSLNGNAIFKIWSVNNVLLITVFVNCFCIVFIQLEEQFVENTLFLHDSLSGVNGAHRYCETDRIVIGNVGALVYVRCMWDFTSALCSHHCCLHCAFFSDFTSAYNLMDNLHLWSKRKKDYLLLQQTAAYLYKKKRLMACFGCWWSINNNSFKLSYSTSLNVFMIVWFSLRDGSHFFNSI